MKLKKLWIERFKNLQDFEIDFESHLTTIIIGGNGTGKSNLLEALAIIFRDLDLEFSGGRPMLFEYYLEYECHGHSIIIDANPSSTRKISNPQLALLEGAKPQKRRSRLHLKVNGQEISMKQFFAEKRGYLPKHVFGYYSGPTNRLAQHFREHQRKFYDEQRRGEDSPLRPLFFALPVHSQFVLLAYFSFPDDEDIKFLEEHFGIVALESVLFIVKEPEWGGKKPHTEDPFWGATGIPRGFLENIFESALAPFHETVKVPIRTGSSIDEVHLYLYLKDTTTLQEVAQPHQNHGEFFKALDTLYISTLIDEVRIRVKRIGLDGDITFTELSEGEQQLLTVLGLLKFTQDTESLFLLDEPDTHLNPAWKLEYLNLIKRIIREESQSQVLIATHDPIVIGSCVKEQVRVLAFENKDNRKVIWHQPEKDPRGMGVAALLTSDVYGLRTSLDWITQEKLDRKRELAAKEPPELTEEEKLELQQLTDELWDLGFTYTERDPLYKQFVEAMMAEVEKHPELQQPVLTKEQQELQAELARKVVANLKAKS